MRVDVAGLHHVTAIVRDPQRNLDFYGGLLGLRLIKRTVNFDDPGTYHFYFGDSRGSPGTILTFFPWPNARKGARGTGQIEATAFTISPDSVGYWRDRLKTAHVEIGPVQLRFEQPVFRFQDPDGMVVELIAASHDQVVEPWAHGPVEPEHSLRGFHSVSAALEGYERTARLLTDVFGYQLIQQQENRFRFASQSVTAPGQLIDLLCLPDADRAAGGAGSVHHIAFRTKDDAAQRHCREELVNLGFNVSPVLDRTYFRSIYFREPGGILFEVATDGPGFAVDESVDAMGGRLCLPPWLEQSRPEIETLLPPINVPGVSGS